MVAKYGISDKPTSSHFERVDPKTQEASVVREGLTPEAILVMNGVRAAVHRLTPNGFGSMDFEREWKIAVRDMDLGRNPQDEKGYISNRFISALRARDPKTNPYDPINRILKATSKREIKEIQKGSSYKTYEQFEKGTAIVLRAGRNFVDRLADSHDQTVGLLKEGLVDLQDLNLKFSELKGDLGETWNMRWRELDGFERSR